MKEFAEKSGKRFALILEDDMEFDSDFADVLFRLLRDDSWDMVKLNGAHSGGNLPVGRLSPKHSLAANLFHQSKSGAYLVNKKAARSYVSKMLPMFVPLDHEFVKFWKYGVRGYSVAPFPSREGGAPSTIDYAQVRKNRLPWYGRLPMLLYKSYIALRRIVHVVFGGAALSALKNKFTTVKK
jgi:glycosyl transferase family 25